MNLKKKAFAVQSAPSGRMGYVCVTRSPSVTRESLLVATSKPLNRCRLQVCFCPQEPDPELETHADWFLFINAKPYWWMNLSFRIHLSFFVFVFVFLQLLEAQVIK